MNHTKLIKAIWKREARQTLPCCCGLFGIAHHHSTGISFRGETLPRIRQFFVFFSGIAIIHLWKFMILMLSTSKKRTYKRFAQRLPTLKFQRSNDHVVVIWCVFSTKNWHKKNQSWCSWQLGTKKKCVHVQQRLPLRRQPQFRSFTSGQSHEIRWRTAVMTGYKSYQ